MNPNLATLLGLVFGFCLSGTWFYSKTTVKMSIETATFMGPFLGGVVGLGAILLGALYNAHLSRKRDGQLRDEEKMSLASALLAELSNLVGVVESTIEWLTLNPKDADVSIVLLYWKSYAEVYHSNIGKLGHFSPEMTKDLVSVYLEFRASMVLFEEGHRTGFKNDPGIPRIVTKMQLWAKSAKALNVKLAETARLPR